MESQKLKYLLGATMTGGGSFICAGQASGTGDLIKGLRTSYYPDCKPLSDENVYILHNYYHFDTKFYGITHGNGVSNTKCNLILPNVISRAFITDKGYYVIQMLNLDKNSSWNETVEKPQKLVNTEIAFKVKEKMEVKGVYFASPDNPEFTSPVILDWEFKDGYIRTVLPELDTYGVLICRFVNL